MAALCFETTKEIRILAIVPSVERDKMFVAFDKDVGLGDGLVGRGTLHSDATTKALRVVQHNLQSTHRPQPADMSL